jgi:hypothetical protein
MGSLSPTHKPDYSNTEPPVSIPPNQDRLRLFFDPWGHLVPTVFCKEIEEDGLDARPSIAVTKAHLKMSELDDAERKGNIKIDGHVVLKSELSGIEVNVSKAALRRWSWSGICLEWLRDSTCMQIFFDRFYFTDESHQLRKSSTTCSIRRYWGNVPGAHQTFRYQSLSTSYRRSHRLHCMISQSLFIFFAHDFKVGNPAFMSDVSKELMLRVHDECMLFIKIFSFLSLFSPL